MIEPIDNADIAKLRAWWKKLPTDIAEIEGMSGEDSERFLYDEIASGLVAKDPDWLSYLTPFAGSGQPNQRATALFFIATNGSAGGEVEALLIKAFRTKDNYLRGTALQGFIHIKAFPLKPRDIEELSDPWLAAWGMSYLSAADPRERITTLTRALKSKNPYMRAFACDIIGDQFIEHLKPKLKPLLKDRNPMVADAAGYNFYEMLE